MLDMTARTAGEAGEVLPAHILTLPFSHNTGTRRRCERRPRAQPAGCCQRGDETGAAGLTGHMPAGPAGGSPAEAIR